MNHSSDCLKGKRIVAVASFDSFIKTAQAMLNACAAHGALTYLIVAAPSKRGPSQRQLVVAGIEDIPAFVPLACAHEHALIKDADALLVLLGSKSTLAFLAKLDPAGAPIIASAFPGLIFRELVASVLARADVDLLCLNSEGDLAVYQTVGQSLGLDTSNGMVTGLPILWGAKVRDTSLGTGPVVFFEQPTIPSTLVQREYLVRGLIDWARRNPDIPLVIKPRAMLGDATPHKAQWTIEKLFARQSLLPSNLTVSHEPIEAILPSARLVLTISSTAALEALAYGVPVRVLSDLGVEEALGNHFFAGAGVYATLDTLELTGPSSETMAWLERNGKPEHGVTDFINRLAELIANPNLRVFGRQATLAHGAIEWAGFQRTSQPGLWEKLGSLLRNLLRAV